MRILIAEDDAAIGRAVKALLEKHKYAVDLVPDGREALHYLTSGQYDLAILDIMMPGRDGLSVLREARSAGITAPVLLLTAKAEIEDRVTGLDAGADDYLPKPFVASEFLARVRALGRRSSTYQSEALAYGNALLDCGRYVLAVAGAETPLNNKEFQLMEFFFRNPKQVFSTSYLMEKVWGANAEADIGVVWTYIGFLRRKLRECGADIEIKTIRGAGYSLDRIC